MEHVFVETNWVFEFCAPAHRSTPEAHELAERPYVSAVTSKGTLDVDFGREGGLPARARKNRASYARSPIELGSLSINCDGPSRPSH